MADMRVNIAGVELKNPVIAASGTFGFGREYAEYYDLSRLGAISVKGLTVNKREGNPPPRIAETYMGMLNSVGLQNPGVDAFIEAEMPYLKTLGTRIIANISGNTPEEFATLAGKCSQAGVDLIEINISCPNVKQGGLAFGTKPDTAAAAVKAAKDAASVPVIAKLSPNVTDITLIARAVEDAGADGISLINTLLGMKIDIEAQRPVLFMNKGGLSGPAVLPVAVRMVYECAQCVHIPIIGMGGISCGADAVEMMLAGAGAVAVGTANLTDPMACVSILGELGDYLDRKNLAASELTGLVKVF